MHYINMLSELLHQLSCKMCDDHNEQFDDIFLILLLAENSTANASTPTESSKEKQETNNLKPDHRTEVKAAEATTQPISNTSDQEMARATRDQQNNSPLENMISQVIGWTLENYSYTLSKNPTTVQKAPESNNSALQPRLNGGSNVPQRSASLPPGPQIVHVQSLAPCAANARSTMNLPQEFHRLPAGPQIAHVQSFAAPPGTSNNIRINNQLQASNNFAARTGNAQNAQTLPPESNKRQYVINQNMNPQWRKDAKEAM